MRKHFPDLWHELKEMDNQTWRNFRSDYSVEELEIRFDFEERRLNQGLSITNKDFHTKLKEVISNAVIRTSAKSLAGNRRSE